MADGHLGDDAKWIAVLTPLWMWDAFILFYHTRVILMGPINRPDHIPEEEWVDPLPMSKRFFSLFRFCLIVLFEALAALKLDGEIVSPWAGIFIPIYVWELTTLWKKLPLARMRIVTVEDLEMALGKPFAEFTEPERELIARRYSVVPSPASPEFEAAHKLKSRARQDVIKLVFRVAFIIFLIIQLDFQLGLNWWLVFTPIWILSLCICCGTFQSFREVVAAAAERDPETFGNLPGKGAIDGSPDAKAEGEDEENQAGGAYGAIGDDEADEDEKKALTMEEKEELKAQVMQSGYRMSTSFCSQAFVLLIVMLFVGKLQEGDYSSIWIISPFLLVAGIILCCLGCTIFCITEIPDDVKVNEAMGMNSSAPFQTSPGDSQPFSSASIYAPPPPPAPAETSISEEKRDTNASVTVNKQNEVTEPQSQKISVGVTTVLEAVGSARSQSGNMPAVPDEQTNSVSPELGGQPQAEPIDLLDNKQTGAASESTTEERKQQESESVMLTSSLHELD